MDSAAATALIESARRHSRYLDRQLAADPLLLDALRAALDVAVDAEAIASWFARTPAPTDDEAALKSALRRLRIRTLCQLIARDLGGLADLDEVTEGMTLLAEITLRSAEQAARAGLVQRFGQPRGETDGAIQPFICIGMGKLGGRELNVSSDVDFIFVYPEAGETDGDTPEGPGKRIDNFDFFTRMGRKVIELLADVTEDGFVFRVDMRLRPNGDSGPLACSFDMLENYFVTQGREWERYAWIKARALTGGRDEELEALRKPFVFRKYLDFGAINAMRDLHAQIRREVARRDMADNIKLGPGGIREIEFIAQVFQLIRGGRESALQIRPTQKVLDRLALRGVLGEEAVAELQAAYVFLRRLEHRLQYVEDAQTHRLPATPDEQALIASAMGHRDHAALMDELDVHRSRVSRHFEAVFGAQEQDSSTPRAVWQDIEQCEDCAGALAGMGFARTDDLAHRLAAFKAGSRYRQLPDGSRTRVDALVPKLLEACRDTPDPSATALRGLDLLEAISRRAAYLALLAEFPQALGQVARLIGASSWAAGYLVRHPILLDELLDARLLTAEPDWPGFEADLRNTLDEVGDDTERQMDSMRDAHHAWVFRLLARDLAGELSVERLSDHLSALADVMLRVTLDMCWRKLARRHRDPPRFAVIAYGKLGGKELGYASDLDLIFLFDDDHESAPEIYARLAQRMLTWLSSHTSAGILFETDTRLRPNGESGLLVSSIASFHDYQLKSAWVWEHQALTRARFSAGDGEVGRRFETIRREVLTRRRDAKVLRREVLDMRQKMMDSHANKSELFDLKHDRGGLIDLEFAVQYLVLAHAADHPELTGNLGNIALLRIAAEAGLLPADSARAAGDAYRELRRLQHSLRLNDATRARLPADQVCTERSAIETVWHQVFDANS
ncbi:bifunctional [glutamate--ammonia ligase]-adenylyl-L-tyrosine phosphorylase/[glutamate--ammonia-ligase] adenylyltransferase [Methyloversatilis thermotolerans]|uniref:bifunctional [glutamate--ammonia ligase]-adenylyl-L-tyrosine phosphorylase/[glutamate--ammonia-ligase] adenylyltransferase n=1 Tax=Methyloversatilis thermotolerans TaxID=1346290 RepID=UPI0003663377|nr:bifunctional [glutamate--ammonia ligase]-adenylyl-L-tyrosine phosphorylase/[glutamate--ammonia-ligase] adenylyltransferase [Methyloversatilis thermotolerans]